MKAGVLKRAVSFLFAATLCVSMSACGGSKQNSAASGNSSAASGNSSAASENESEASAASFEGKTITLGVWGGNDAEANALNKVIADFESQTGAKVELKTYTDYNTQIQADFIGKTAPDVFYMDANVFPFYAGLGVMEPLDKDEFGVSHYYDNLIDAFTGEDGNVYALPKDSSTLAVYYNIDLLDSVGMTKDDIPTAWEDYVTFLPELQSKLDEVHGKGSVTAMTVNLELARNLHLLERGGASVSDDEGNSTLNTEGIKKNLQFILDIVDTGAYKTPKDLGLGWNGEVFGTGKTVLMDEGNWVYGSLKQDYSNINFGVMDMPSYEGTKSSMAFTVGYAVSSSSKEKALAKEWVKYATGPEGMMTWTTGAGVLPSRADLAEQLKAENDPVLTVHFAQVEYAVPWQKGTTIDTIGNAYTNYIQQLTNGQIGLDEALEKMDTQANSEIENSR